MHSRSHFSPPDPEGNAQRKHRSLREKSLSIGLSVSGIARVSGARLGCVRAPFPSQPITDRLTPARPPETRRTASPPRRFLSSSTKSTVSSPRQRRPCSTRSVPRSRSSGSPAAMTITSLRSPRPSSGSSGCVYNAICFQRTMSKVYGA